MIYEYEVVKFCRLNLLCLHIMITLLLWPGSLFSSQILFSHPVGTVSVTDLRYDGAVIVLIE